MRKHGYLLLFIIVCLINYSSYSQDISQIKITPLKLTEGIYVLYGAGGNIGVSVGEDGVLIIDSQFEELSEKIRSEISNISKMEVKYLLNTNWHYDHVSGNASFAKSGATIIAHKTTRDRMKYEQFHPSFGTKVPVYPDEALPVVCVENFMKMYYNGNEIEIFHMKNAHSDSDLIFRFKEANVIHTGDICFNGMYPFIDVPHSGSINGMIDAVDEIIGLMDEETIIIPGHGEIMNMENIKEYRNMLVGTRKNISELIMNGKNIDDIIDLKPTSEFDEGRTRFEKADSYIKIIYNDLTGKYKTK